MKKVILILSFFVSSVAFSQVGTNLSNYASSATMNQATLDGGSVFNINQTTSSVVLTIPNPTTTNAQKNLKIRNVGTAGLTLLPGGYLPPSTTVSGTTMTAMILLDWNGTSYSVTGSPTSNYPQPQNTIMAGPVSAPGLPGFRVLDPADISIYVETDPQFNTKLALKSTTDLAEGTNLYYTASRFNTAFAGKTTTDLSEGTNQYFTTARARAASSAGTAITYSGGVITNTAPDQTVVLTGSNGITTSGTYPNFTIAKTKRQETYSGTTNGSGDYTVTFGTAYGVAPNIQVELIAGTTEQQCRVVSVSTTGFTVNAFARVNVLGLALSTATSAVSGATIHVLVTEF